ncbi:hypothetical protein HDV00_012479 [Rhizophlyctis rosea]|nr:hypothetical protein HDV00_012479 [Rhizophlyctis rosea]
MSLSSAPTQQFFFLYICGQLHPESVSDGTTKRGLTLPSFDQCNMLDDVQVLTAQWTLTLSLASTIPSLLSIPIYGVLLDRTGRKPILLTSMLSAVLGVLSYLSVATLNAGLWILVLTNIIAGCMGSFAVLSMAVFAYLADTTTPDQRTKTFVMSEAAMFVAMTLGPFLGGVLSRILPSGVVGVFYFTLFGYILSFIYVLAFLPESYYSSATETTPTFPTNRSSLTALLEDIKSSLVSSISLLTTHTQTSHTTRLLLSILFLLSTAFGAYMIFFYYTMKIFQWDSYKEGIWMLVQSVTQTAWMVGFFPWLMGRLVGERGKEGFAAVSDEEREADNGDSNVQAKLQRALMEVYVTRAGLGVLVGGYLVLAVANTEWLVYIVTIINGFGTLARPTLRGLLSRTVPGTLQGRLLSSCQLVEQVGTLISGIIYPSLWASTVSTVPGAFLLFTAGLYLAAMGLAFRVRSEGMIADDEGQAGGKKRTPVDPEDAALLDEEFEMEIENQA